jgi:hypothetical protein
VTTAINAEFAGLAERRFPPRRSACSALNVAM